MSKPTFYNLLIEKCGVLNRYHNEMTENLKKLNNLYNRIRQAIIRHSNNGRKEINFEILNISLYFKYIKKLVIIYRPNTNTNTLMAVSNTINDGEYNLNINISIFDPDFKSTFFHEFHHFYQIIKTFKGGLNPDYIDIIYKFNLSLTECEKDTLEILPSILYLYDPQEYNARKEEVYKYTYEYTLSNLTESDEKILEYVQKYFNNLFSLDIDIKNFIYKNKDILLPYIWTLIIFCCIEKLKLTRSRAYNIFNYSKFYLDKHITQTIEKISNNSNNDIHTSAFKVYLEIIDAFDKFKEHVGLVSFSLLCLEYKLNDWQFKFKDKIKQAATLAVKDAKSNNKNELLYDLMKIDSSGMCVEIVCKTGTSEYICDLKGLYLNDIFFKMFILKEYIKTFNYKIDTYFGFVELQNMYNLKEKEYSELSPNFDYFQLLTCLEDIQDIISSIDNEYYTL